MEKVYAVMVEGKQTPSRLHYSYDEAQAEAERLAKKEKRTAFVLKAVTKLEVSEVKIISLEQEVAETQQARPETTVVGKKRRTHASKIKVNWAMVDDMLRKNCEIREIAQATGVASGTLYSRCVLDNRMPFTKYSKIRKSEGKEARLAL